MKLDKLDYKILHELDRNSRISTSDLARRVKHGRDIVDYRLNRLYSERVILSAGVIVNPYALGLTMYKTYLKLKNNTEIIRQLMKQINESPSVFCYAECDGNWDLIFTIIAASSFEFNEIYNQIVVKYEEIILEHQFAMVVHYHLFSKKYFLNDKSPHVCTIGGKPRSLNITEDEFLVLTAIAKNARATVVELAEQTGLTPIMIRNRLERLEKESIILGYRLQTNRSVLGMTSFKTQLDLATFKPQAMDSLLKYCTSQPAISKFIVQLGFCKLECNFEVKSYDEFTTIIADLKHKFPNIIRNSSIVIIKSESTRWIYKDKKSAMLLSQAA